MKPGMRYIVTQPSRNGELLVGDRVQLLDDGDILNITAGGWMDSADIPAATQGMQVAPDTEWAERRRLELERSLAEVWPK